VLLLAEAHLSTGGLIASGAVLALVCDVALLTIGATAGLVPVLGVSAGVSVAAVGGLVLLPAAFAPSADSARAPASRRWSVISVSCELTTKPSGCLSMVLSGGLDRARLIKETRCTTAIT
jgi:hypothetical protein